MIRSKQLHCALVWFVPAALVMMSAIASCVAPDAQPGPEKPVPTTPPPPPPPPEPPKDAGKPQLGLGFGESTKDQRAFDIAFDASKNEIVTTIGYFGAITIPGVPPENFTSAVRDVLVLRHAADGTKPIWAVQLASSGDVTRSVVAVDADGSTYVAGGVNGVLTLNSKQQPMFGSYDGFVIKLDTAGGIVWARTFGNGLEQFVTDIAVDAAGDVIITGVGRGDAINILGVSPPKISDDDLFVAKLDPANGNAKWALRPGKAGWTNPLEPTATVTTSADGSIFVGGSHAGTLQFVAPDASFSCIGQADGFVVKLDPTGKHVWHRAFGAASRRQRVTSIAVSSKTQDVVFTSAFSGTISLLDDESEKITGFNDSLGLLVAKLDSEGNHVWSRGYGRTGTQQPNQTIFLDDDDRPFVMGTFDGVIELSGEADLANANLASTTDLFAVKFNADGTPFWGATYGDKAWQIFGSATLWKDASGNNRAIMVGANGGTLDIVPGMSSVASQGFEDVFMMWIAH